MPKQINLLHYTCNYTNADFDKFLAKIYKKLVKGKKKTAKPKCIILMGAPGSGKSTVSNSSEFKNFVNIDADKIIDEMPEMKKLKSKKIKHGELFPNCVGIAVEIANILGVRCIKNKLNFISHFPFELPNNFLYELKNAGYQIDAYILYTPKSFARNLSRPSALNIPKTRYRNIVRSLHEKDFFNLFMASDKFVVINTTNKNYSGKEYSNDQWSDFVKAYKRIIILLEKSVGLRK